MKNLDKLIIMLFIILIISCILIFIIYSKVQKEEQTNIEGEYADISQDFIEPMKRVQNYSTFFSVEKMVNNYMQQVYNSNVTGIYNILDKDYITKNNITIDNILEHVANIKGYKPKVKIKEIYSQTNERNTIYYINCLLD